MNRNISRWTVTTQLHDSVHSNLPGESVPCVGEINYHREGQSTVTQRSGQPPEDASVRSHHGSMQSVNARSQSSYHTPNHTGIRRHNGYANPSYRQGEISGQRNATLPEAAHNRISASSSWVDQCGHQHQKTSQKKPRAQIPSNGYLVLGSQLKEAQRNNVQQSRNCKDKYTYGPQTRGYLTLGDRQHSKQLQEHLKALEQAPIRANERNWHSIINNKDNIAVVGLHGRNSPDSLSVDIDSNTDSLSDCSYLAQTDTSLENSIVTDHLESDNILEDTSGSTNSLNTVESTLAAQRGCNSTVISHVTEDSGVDLRHRYHGNDSRTKHSTTTGPKRRTRPKAAGRQRSAAQPSPFLV